jgi:translation initiation factor 1 (eIF-1/SUI1)
MSKGIVTVKVIGYDVNFGNTYIYIVYYRDGEAFRQTYCTISGLPLKITLSSLAKCLRKRRQNRG